MNLLLLLYGFLKVLLHQDLLIVEIVSQSVSLLKWDLLIGVIVLYVGDNFE